MSSNLPAGNEPMILTHFFSRLSRSSYLNLVELLYSLMLVIRKRQKVTRRPCNQGLGFSRPHYSGGNRSDRRFLNLDLGRCEITLLQRSPTD